jgi:pimeloyl-ACP methyl ester carboxylesterase
MTNPNTILTVPIRPLRLPSWLPRSEWPFHTFGIEVDDSILAVTEAGEGPVLLFVHVGTWSFIWRDLIAQLAPDFRCICLDAPGNGRTLDTGPVSLERAGRAVTAVIDALDLRDLTLVAHDLGGPAALAAVARMPERVRGIVGMNAFAWKPTGTAFRTMLAIMGSRIMREFDVLTGFLPRIASTSFGVGRHLDRSGRGTFRAGMSSRARRAFHDYLRDARQCDGLYRTVARALKGPLSPKPVLTIFGERNDPFGFQKRWKELFPEARQEIVARGNHFPMCDAPEFVAETIRSWYRQSVQPG